MSRPASSQTSSLDTKGLPDTNLTDAGIGEAITDTLQVSEPQSQEQGPSIETTAMKRPRLRRLSSAQRVFRNQDVMDILAEAIVDTHDRQDRPDDFQGTWVPAKGVTHALSQFRLVSSISQQAAVRRQFKVAKLDFSRRRCWIAARTEWEYWGLDNLEEDTVRNRVLSLDIIAHRVLREQRSTSSSLRTRYFGRLVGPDSDDTADTEERFYRHLLKSTLEGLKNVRSVHIWTTPEYLHLLLEVIATTSRRISKLGIHLCGSERERRFRRRQRSVLAVQPAGNTVASTLVPPFLEKLSELVVSNHHIDAQGFRLSGGTITRIVPLATGLETFELGHWNPSHQIAWTLNPPIEHLTGLKKLCLRDLSITGKLLCNVLWTNRATLTELELLDVRLYSGSWAEVWERLKMTNESAPEFTKLSALTIGDLQYGKRNIPDDVLEICPFDRYGPMVTINPTDIAVWDRFEEWSKFSAGSSQDRKCSLGVKISGAGLSNANGKIVVRCAGVAVSGTRCKKELEFDGPCRPRQFQYCADHKTETGDGKPASLRNWPWMRG